MRALVDALSDTRPKSPASQVDNDEPIELAHYPDAMKPPPGAQPPIERDDFPAPPYPYTDPERRRRWSDTYKVLLYRSVFTERYDVLLCSFEGIVRVIYGCSIFASNLGSTCV